MGLPFCVMLATVPAAEIHGTMVCRPLAPTPTLIVKLSVSTFHPIALNDEPFRPSSQVSICSEETMGTPRASAAATVASDCVEAA